ncbi:MAG TPA: vWA domain-containing protein [Candidatus Eisenbacteria bacterium]|nr:vWA domain-containing protein [Candidatus Eisenbacteria bacterium]
MSPPPPPVSSFHPRAARSAVALLVSILLHVVFVALVIFDVTGLGGGFGIGVGPGFGIGSGGGPGLGEQQRREIFSLEDIPDLVRPQEPNSEQELTALLAPREAERILVPQPAKPKTATSTNAPVIQFARPVKPIGAGTDLGARLAAAGAGSGGIGLGGGGGGLGWSLGSSFGKYVGGLRKVGLDVAIVVDSTGSMQNIIDDLKRRLQDLVRTMQRLVPTARIGAVAYRDRTDDKVATAPRQSEDFLVKWSDLTYNASKVQSFLGGIVAEGGGDWKEAVKEGLETAMKQLKWRPDAKKVIIIVGSSPPHDEDLPAIRNLIADWRARNGYVSTIDVSYPLHAEHERKLNRWLYGEEPKEISPLPEFYKELQQSFHEISKQGGGTDVALGEDAALVRNVLVLAFGSQWEKEVGRVARGR